MLNFVFIRGVVSFILVTGVQKTPKTSKFVTKRSKGQKVATKGQEWAVLGGRKGAQLSRS